MQLPIHISPESAEPLYHQIKVQLRELILSGKLKEGTPLPSIRELAVDVSCSIITIRRVYQDLEAEGLIRTKQGTGTFVEAIQQQDLEQHKLDSVYTKFREAVDNAFRYKTTPEEMHRLVNEAIREYESEQPANQKGERSQ